MARGFRRVRDGHSSATPVARRLKQPTRTATRTRVGAGLRFRENMPRCRPYSVLLPVGFAVPLPLPEARCALTAPFHPCVFPLPLSLPRKRGRVGWGNAVSSLWHFP